MAKLDPIFGIHAEAMSVQRKRMEVLSANIANADTPGFQARDVDFASTLASVVKSDPQGTPHTLTTDARHIPMNAGLTGNPAGDGSRLAYRVPMQPSADGNSVDVQIEQAKFAEAALHYQASLQFADGRIRGLMTAITGQ